MTDEKSNSLMADLNTDLNEPASPDDVNEVNSRKAGCTEPEQKTDQSAKIDLPDPDLTRLFKKPRSRRRYNQKMQNHAGRRSTSGQSRAAAASSAGTCYRIVQ